MGDNNPLWNLKSPCLKVRKQSAVEEIWRSEKQLDMITRKEDWSTINTKLKNENNPNHTNPQFDIQEDKLTRLIVPQIYQHVKRLKFECLLKFCSIKPVNRTVSLLMLSLSHTLSNI